MSRTLYDDILERLERVPLEGNALDHLLAALSGQQTSEEPDERSAASLGQAYLKSVTVTGFRGIGPTARIDFRPGPGLTVVCGRNGSGKSSFAEGLEVLVTGEVRRLKGRTGVWRSGWRSLHSALDPAVSAEVLMEGVKGPVTLTGTWDATAKLEDCKVRVKVPGEPDADRQRLGWGQALELYRPFLSHSELEVVLDKPSDLHDQINAVLGLEELREIAERLVASRKAQQTIADSANKLVAPLLGELQVCPDARAERAADILSSSRPDLEAVETLVTGGGAQPVGELALLDSLRQLVLPTESDLAVVQAELRDAAERLERVGASAAGMASSSADLLAMALSHFDMQGPGDCPVCGRPGALTDEWQKQTENQIERLRAEAAEMRSAHAAARGALATVTRMLSPAPSVLTQALRVGIDPAKAGEAWKNWSAITLESADSSALRQAAEHLSTTYPPLLEALSSLTRAAAEEYERRLDTWSPVALKVAEWCTAERAAAGARDTVKQIKKAEDWLKDANHHLRNERLRPYVDGASHFWSQLRQESNVDLLRISLEGSNTRRAVEFDLSVDGTSAPGLPVLSQGETNALALSVFLPRATAEGSPFRCVVIDDPVQAMDPSKVDGLARVLAEVAQERQVIVFTHDDRLPEAVRRLNLGGSILQVSRKSESVVDLSSALDPSTQLLSDAGKLARGEDVPLEVAKRVIPGLCREAIESVCYEIVRKRRLGRGDSHASVEDALRQPTTLVSRLALGIFDDSGRGGEVYGWLNSHLGNWATDTVQLCNKGSHGGAGFRGATLVGDARRMTERLRERFK